MVEIAMNETLCNLSIRFQNAFHCIFQRVHCGIKEEADVRKKRSHLSQLPYPNFQIYITRQERFTKEKAGEILLRMFEIIEEKRFRKKVSKIVLMLQDGEKLFSSFIPRIFLQIFLALYVRLKVSPSFAFANSKHLAFLGCRQF